ncbi:hypothetical protein BpHYR1_030343 [Brachionus plicatilis]|uniref:Uncharacterized protein n=1 Tax=Brachionus plicatilis TaxID=10195 RepID=A0A3M7QBP4_BRAPC|nr:hypothetical protein BpHYR1_030343 [Brachionus plicatilis]
MKKNTYILSPFFSIAISLPNLNHIEMLWNEMKEFAREKIVFTIADAALAIREFEKSLTVEKCRVKI